MALEETMAQLAHSQVSLSLPSLSNDIQGFQIIESNEDINSAIGVLVALIGNLVDYIPAIFRKGKIYNMDIMYIPEMHQWLPTQDNWITYLKSRRADVEAMLVDHKSQGSAGSVDLDIPLLKIIKTASEKFDKKYIERVGVPTVLREAGEILKNACSPEAIDKLVIPSAVDLLKKCASSEAAIKIVNTITRNSDVADAFVQYYTDDQLLDVAKAVVGAIKEVPEEPEHDSGEVKILTSASKEARDLTDIQKAEILRDGAVIVDTRGISPTKIYKTNKNANSWSSPSLNGVYELLQMDGSTVTAYVVVGPRKARNSWEDPKGFNYVIPLDDNMSRTVVKVPAEILGQSLPLHQFNLSGGCGLDNIPSNCDSYLLVDIDGTALEVSNVNPQYIGRDGEVAIGLGQHARAIAPNNSQAQWDSAEHLAIYRRPDDFAAKVTQIIKIPSGGRLRIKGSTIFAPEKCRLFSLSNSGNLDMECPPRAVDDTEDTAKINRQRKLNLATMDEFVDAVSRREKLLSIKVYNDVAGFVISDNMGRTTDPLNKRAAAFDLVKQYAIAPDTAKEMLAGVGMHKQERFLAKLAAEASYALSFSEQSPSQPDSSSVDLNGELDGDARVILQQAGNSGVKEVMDVTVLKLLAEDGSSVRMIQDMIPQLFSAMNAVGQILFMLRASTTMTEAYGEYRADEMEKQFTKLMQRLGDAVIVLQQGRVDDLTDLLEGPLSSTLG